jgi:hypothetical protein
MKNISIFLFLTRVFTIYIFILIISLIGKPLHADVWTYQIPGGQQYLSTDYVVEIEQDGKIYPAWVHYSYTKDEYIKYSSRTFKPEGKVAGAKGTISHSAAHFSFDKAVKIRVTVLPGAKGITLPLTSARVLPSSYSIPCKIENGNTIVFTLTRPEKIAIIANYEKAWDVFASKSTGHVPIQSHLDQSAYNRSDFHGRDLLKEISEGYKNPLFIIALAPEADIPDKDAKSTLIVNPGDMPSQAELDKYQTVWFKPGIHDFSYLGNSPLHWTLIKGGQTFYLEGGSYVMACFRKSGENGGARIIGRGMISGMSPKHLYMLPTVSINLVDTVRGITVIDRAARGIHNARHIEDVTMLGAWHGNNNGVHDLDHSTVLNCLFICHDDNLKLGSHTHAKHIVLWQAHNAHPIMVYEYGGVTTTAGKSVAEKTVFANTVVEDIDIIMYSANAERQTPWTRHTGSAIAVNLGRINMDINNFTFRDIRIESPFLFRVFTIYNLDSAKPYAASWFKTDFFYTSKKNHTRINGLTLENISVNSPLILYRSILGSDYDNSLSNVKFTNLLINGVNVSDQNKNDFFEIHEDRINGLSFLKN